MAYLGEEADGEVTYVTYRYVYSHTTFGQLLRRQFIRMRICRCNFEFWSVAETTVHTDIECISVDDWLYKMQQNGNDSVTV